jgi:hypothetical protein
MTESRILIRDLLFGAGAASGDAVFEMSPVSGYVGYRHNKKLYREEERKTLSLPPTREEATRAAKAYLAERHLAFTRNALLQQAFANTLTRGKPLAYPFSLIPPPRWLKHAGTHLVRNDKHDQPDHWLCTFQVEVEAPDGRKLPVYGSSLELRLGESAGAGGPAARYEVVGFRSRWRPVYEPYRVQQFLPDTGEPEHDPHEAASAGHAHVDETTLLAYVLADENVPQFNLLPYEATVSGEHHMSVIPASRDSLWVEMRVSKAGGKYGIQALILGGSGSFKAYWGFWNPFAWEPAEQDAESTRKAPPASAKVPAGGAFRLKQERRPASLSRAVTGPDVQLYLTELVVDEGVVEVVLHVFDETLQNFIAKRILLNIHAADTPPAMPAIPAAEEVYG